MNPDDLKAAWQAQTARAQVSVDTDVLLKVVRRNQRTFDAMILWRDVREVSICLVLVPLWFYWGAKDSLPWTWYLVVPTLLWIAGFLLVDRMQHKPRRPQPSDPLGERIEKSLHEIEHQIHLLRNVFWWYLLPPGIAILAFFGQCTWESRDGGWLVALIMGGVVTVEVLVFAGIYWLNQHAIRSDLEPRRQELQGLLASLQDSTGPPKPPESGGAGAWPQKSSWLNLLGILALFMLTGALSLWAYRAGAVAFDPGYCPTAGDAAVTNLLVPIRNRNQVPAIAGAVVTSKGLVAVGVVGTRKLGTEAAVTLDDQWHLGSDGKAMTATLVAKLVEQHRLRWDSTLAEIFPELAPGFGAEARAITILHLLSHHSGLKPNPDLAAYRGADGRKERLRLVKEELSRPLMHKPGAQLEYSNLGYAIAGAVIEQVTGKTWEQAMQDEVFRPLGMASVGFGGTGTPGVVDEPWGHDAKGKPVPDNGPAMDNPPVLSPAGRIHCTIQDWGKFIADQLRGEAGGPALLRQRSYQTLHSPPFGGEYALGWAIWDRPWGGGKVLNHCGDNTMNFANAWVAPLRDFAVLCCVNQSGNTAFKASDEAATALISLHAKMRK